jgi:hypothetical protein
MLPIVTEAAPAVLLATVAGRSGWRGVNLTELPLCENAENGTRRETMSNKLEIELFFTLDLLPEQTSLKMPVRMNATLIISGNYE